MGVFQTFWVWLNAQLALYIGENTARAAAALEPAIVTAGVLYVMAWGFLQLTGRIEEPMTAGLKRIAVLALVLGVSLRLWLYNEIIVSTFYEAPAQLAAAIVGAAEPVASIDAIWEQGGAVAAVLWEREALFWGDLGAALAGLVVWLLVGLLCVYTMFLIALSSVALAVLLALGPFFFAMLLFERTRRFFDAWLAQLANYGLITILTVLVAALMLRIVQSYAEQTAALGAEILTMDAVNMVLVCALIFLLMRQIMPIAAALAGGVALSTLGGFSQLASWALRQGVGLGDRLRRSAAAAQDEDGMQVPMKVLR